MIPMLNLTLCVAVDRNNLSFNHANCVGPIIAASVVSLLRGLGAR